MCSYLVPATTISTHLTGMVIVTSCNYIVPFSGKLRALYRHLHICLPNSSAMEETAQSPSFYQGRSNAFAQGHSGTQRLRETVALRLLSGLLTHWLWKTKFITLSSETLVIHSFSQLYNAL
uniref:Uncharacterized protein n=1 Tax=Myotis myotis TaxID=51298 RepID=A0A7J7UPS3_MYOMY|nr:hypothetical protein mMyoMyo1_008588 [Myotis myotis]